MQAVPIVRARVGGADIALAADAVAQLAQDSASVPHLGALLGTPPDDRAAPADRRVLVLRAGGITARVRVDGPVAFELLTAPDVAWFPAALAACRSPLVLGLARLGGVTVSLIDAALAARVALDATAEEDRA